MADDTPRRLTLTPKEAAPLFGKSPAVIRRWVREGILPARRIGRLYLLPAAALEEFAKVKEV